MADTKTRDSIIQFLRKMQEEIKASAIKTLTIGVAIDAGFTGVLAYNAVWEIMNRAQTAAIVDAVVTAATGGITYLLYRKQKGILEHGL